MRRLLLHRSVIVILVLVFLSGCSSTKVCKDFNNLTTPDGTAIAHLNTSNLAVHLLMGKKPVWGDANLTKTLNDFTLAAKTEGASKVRIVQSNQTNWWFVFFPFSLLVTPVTSNVAGDALS